MNLPHSLERLMELYRNYHALAQVTVGLLEQTNYEALDDAWAKRRELFKRLTSARNKMDPVFANWQAELDSLSPSDAERCSQSVKDIERLGKATLELDNKAAAIIRQLTNDIKGKLNHLQMGRKALQAYHGVAKPPSIPKLISKSE